MVTTMTKIEAVTAEAGEVLHATRALCPHCLAALSADIVAHDDGTVWMTRDCPEHGTFETYLWPDRIHYEHMRSLAFPPVAPLHAIPMTADCPRACGICSHHARKATLAEIEVTQRCNLRCPVCFMAAEHEDDEMTPERFRSFFQAIADATGFDTGVQLTGGEPTVRSDLADIVAIGREMGFWGIEVNTNGVVISHDLAYLEGLVAAGLTGIYLQFDGLTPEPYQQIRGSDLLAVKLAAIENCRHAGVQVVLAMTIVAGLNDDQIGDVIRFALENNDVVAGIALQPAFTSGRFETNRAVPLTMGDVIFMLEEQTQGIIHTEDIWPLGCSHPLCDTGTYLVRGEGDTFTPLTRDLTRAEYLEAYDAGSPQGSVFLDIATRRQLNLKGGLSLIIMNYMDAATMDLERMEQCSMFCTMADGRLVPFCSYQLTDCAGRRVHPPLGLSRGEGR
jgi:7,8-dihydro-6-hydroxymethylpterin dimethyltransferase